MATPVLQGADIRASNIIGSTVTATTLAAGALSATTISSPVIATASLTDTSGNQVAAIGPPGGAAMLNIDSAAQSGIATIPAAGTTIAVPQTLLTANAVIVATWLNPPPVGGLLHVVITPGTGFSITSTVAVVDATAVGYFIVHV